MDPLLSRVAPYLLHLPIAAPRSQEQRMSSFSEGFIIV